MALSGSQEFSAGAAGAAGYYRLGISWTATQNVAANQSTITYSVYIRSTASSYAAWDASANASTTIVKLANTQIHRRDGAFDCRSLQYYYLVRNASITVNHDAAGNYNQVLSVSFAANNLSSYKPDGSGSLTISLNQIARASTIAATRANIGEGTTITIDSKSSSFRHTVSYTFGSLSGTVATNRTGGTFVWMVPTSFYGQIPDTTSKTCTLRCTTFSGGDQIGSTTSVSFVAAVSVTPTISGFTAIDTNSATVALTGDNTKFISDASTVCVNITGAGTPGATVESKGYKSTIGDKSATGNPSTITLAKWGTIADGQGTIQASITDSRGLTGNSKKTVSVVDYFRCGFQNVDMRRANETSDEVVISYRGTFWNSSFGSITNTLSVKARYRERGTTTWSSWHSLSPTVSSNSFSGQSSLSPLSYQKHWEVELQAVDTLNTASLSKIVPKGIPLVQYGDGKVVVNGELSIGESSRAANGYVELPSGLILQWGEDSGTKTVNFPKAFPNACLFVTTSGQWRRTSSPPYLTMSGAFNWTATGFSLGTFGYFNLGASGESPSTQSYRSIQSGANFGGFSRWLAIGY